MSDLSISHLRRLDPTLLLMFLSLVQHRKATDVVADLGPTQSATSQAVKRLSDIFDDEMFLRRPHGMDPTAVALKDPVRHAPETLRGCTGHCTRL